MEYGQLGALNYRMTFPGQQQEEAIPGRPQPVEYEGYLPPQSKDPLAVREGLTDAYYNNYATLQAVVKDALSKGQNPFEPDYSQDGGGLAFKTFQRAQANLMHSANALRGEYEAEQQMRPLLSRGDTRMKQGVDTNGLYMSDPNNFYPTALDPSVIAANRELEGDRYTQRDSNAVNQAIRNPQIQRFQQLIQSDPQNAEYYQHQIDSLLTNTPQTAYQQLIPRGGRGGLTQEDLSRRAELIKQVKRGILTRDQTPINMLKLVPGVEDVGYINTGDKVGLEVYFKGQGQPSFVDLSKGAGEGDINALLNRIEGQKNVPNEAVFSFDTKVNIPPSNARQILEDIKAKIAVLPEDSSVSPDVLPQLQELAADSQLITSNGEPINSISVSEPNWFSGFFGGKNSLVIKYNRKLKNGKIDYSREVEEVIEDPEELKNFIELNANQIAPAFGAGFSDAPVQPKVINPGGKKIW
jgi:hypothetical protein